MPGDYHFSKRATASLPAQNASRSRKYGDEAHHILEVHPAIVSRYGPVKKALKRAATTPSRLGRQPPKRATERGVS